MTRLFIVVGCCNVSHTLCRNKMHTGGVYLRMARSMEEEMGDGK